MMQHIDLAIAICAGLGIVLLFLCVVLATLLVYLHCKRQCVRRGRGLGGGAYRVVDANGCHTAENGTLLDPDSYSSKNPIILKVETDERKIIKNRNAADGNSAPVKKKLLWKKKRKRSLKLNDVQFSEEELQVPKGERIFKKRNESKLKLRPRSKSDWDISELSLDTSFSASEDGEAAAGGNQKNFVYHPPPLSQDFRSMEMGTSQYFDALETIDEDEEHEDNFKEIKESQEFGSSDEEDGCNNEITVLTNLSESTINKGPNQEDEESLAGIPNGFADESTPIVEKPELDPIVGRYRMTSSEGFDEFMKSLGVGLMKRKLANSVTPVNVVEIEDGEYTIRTETTVRTTEIKFRLNETFPETTIDGRVTQTMPTRTGNVLTLTQKGDKSRKEKDSEMVRDFQGDLMYMTLKTEDALCKRVYQRIAEE